jgi:3'(2'), 5'-bisphosphate nucleotidase
MTPHVIRFNIQESHLMEITRQLLDQVVNIAHLAGQAILEVYHDKEGFDTDTKADNSPVTKADLAAHAIIEPALAAIDLDIPVLSEESTIPDYEIRSTWHQYWIVDPLDGTKEFIKRNGEFTVNIALIENGVPVLGVVYVPVADIYYIGAKHIGAAKITSGKETPIKVKSLKEKATGEPLVVVASRSHGSEAVEECIEKLTKEFGKVERSSMGSSLKLCLVAEGAADIYPRLAPTSEWDTAAAQAVVEAAGGTVVDAELKELRYNAKADILNPYFYVLGDTKFNWAALL